MSATNIPQTAAPNTTIRDKLVNTLSNLGEVLRVLDVLNDIIHTPAGTGGKPVEPPKAGDAPGNVEQLAEALLARSNTLVSYADAVRRGL